VQRIAKQFADTFASWNLQLPDQALTQRARGEIDASGWHISYLFGRDERGEYLDYYASHRLADDSHVRIRANGDVEELPTIVSGYFGSDDPEEDDRLREEYFARNRQIVEVLRRKGFLRADGNV
jgi:hypothetical protein